MEIQNNTTLRGAWRTVVLLAAFAAASAAGGDHPNARDPFEPTVTREENALIAAAMDVAATNSAQAIRMLAGDRLPDASPALDFAIGNLHFQNERLDEAATAYRAAIEALKATSVDAADLQSWQQQSNAVFRELMQQKIDALGGAQ